FYRRRLRPAGKVLRRGEDRHRPFRQREGADDPGHPRYAHHHHLQGVLTSPSRAEEILVSGCTIPPGIIACSCSTRQRELATLPLPLLPVAVWRARRSTGHAYGCFGPWIGGSDLR